MLLDSPDPHLACAGNEEEASWVGEKAIGQARSERKEKRKKKKRNTDEAGGENGHGSPGEDLEEVVGAGDQVEAVTLGNFPLSAAKGAKVAQNEVGLEVGELGKLGGAMSIIRTFILEATQRLGGGWVFYNEKTEGSVDDGGLRDEAGMGGVDSEGEGQTSRDPVV